MRQISSLENEKNEFLLLLELNERWRVKLNLEFEIS